MTDSTPESNPTRSAGADAAPGASDAAVKGAWVRQWEPGPPPHRCPTPRPTGAHDGDLWRCAECGRLWAVEAYQLAGVSPMSPMELRWVRPRLRARIRYSRLVQALDWQIIVLGAALVVLIGASVLADVAGWLWTYRCGNGTLGGTHREESH